MHSLERGSTGVGATCFHLDPEHQSKENMLGVTYKFQPVSCHSSAQCREGGDKSLSHFVSNADTNRVVFHVTDAARRAVLKINGSSFHQSCSMLCFSKKKIIK